MRPGWTDAARRALLLAAVAVCLGVAWWSGIGEWLSLARLKASQAQLVAWHEASPALSVGAYMAVYVASAALSLPWATALTLGGAAVFGFWTTLWATSLSSTVGATLAFLGARYVFRDAVRRRFGHRMARLDEGLARDGAFYLFGLRLVPAFPFFLVNLLMGLTAMPVRTYFWVSLVGMLPGTAVYVNAGRELGAVTTPGDVLSPGLLAAMTLLGVFPLVARKVLDRVRSRGAASGSGLAGETRRDARKEDEHGPDPTA
ncbi:TVP38/TMEM64 family protein [Nitratidesulfovibrio liaohensis]|uniref:TVP38/TMEM64 family membrane protein n=1 Tax=Nitratidesulfovibrio liaohensis TaxID=2604158 RepID=A0ABY9R434_9BACT|nr:TVP38/TMEM64 family protein [Nitratidesulfovibrio liaohensis]WMW66515.1 TVP38/TMEM64 family protein [Nitratidesulfovibrio liaohensis]